MPAKKKEDYPILRGPKNIKQPTPKELEKMERDQKIRTINRRNPGRAV